MGQYWSSRRPDSGFLRLITLLGQAKIVAGKDGTLTVSDFKDDAGAPLVWREMGPFVWTDPSGKHMMAAAVKNGKVMRVGEDFPAAFTVLQPVPFADDSRWNLPLLIGMVVVLLATVILWPIQALVRRRHSRSFPLTGTTALLYRVTRIAALLDLAALGGYFAIAQMAGPNLAVFDDPLDIWLRVLQLVCLLGVAGAVLALWNFVRVWGELGRSWWAKASVSLTTLALAAFVWFVILLQLVTGALNY